MQLTLTVFAVQQQYICDETLNVVWGTLSTHAIQSNARKAMRELLARNAGYTLRIVGEKQQVTL